MADVSDTALADPVAARGRLARVYAESLLAAAGGSADAVGEELAALVGGLRADPAAAAYLASPAVSKRKKAPVLASAFGSASAVVRNLVGVLNQNNRLGLLAGVQSAYQTLLDTRAGRVRVKVRSAAPLEDDQKQRLADTLRGVTGADPVLELKVDPALLGGLVVQIGDRVIDTSVRTRIETIRTQLMAKGTSYVLHQN